jgi:GcrA cell cycle regulator
MEPTNWPPEHSDALRNYLAKGMSYSEIAEAINAKFSTVYSRNATIGRAKRMGLAGPDRHSGLPKPQARPNPSRLQKSRERSATESIRPMPTVASTERVKLRCIQIVPRHLSLIDLEAGDCRYPYGGDEEGEAITFCGHPQREGSSYCTGHFHLTRGPGTASERAAVPVSLRLVEAA